LNNKSQLLFQILECYSHFLKYILKTPLHGSRLNYSQKADCSRDIVFI